MPSQMMEIQSKDSCSIFNAADAQIHARDTKHGYYPSLH
jgi:hypothetical protein